jgi:hypothetical protein
MIMNAASAQATYNSLTASPKGADQGTNIVITGTLPTNGTNIYNYQWLVSYSNGSTTRSISANSICTTPSGFAGKGVQVQCIFHTNASTPTGLYTFSLSTNPSVGISVFIYPAIKQPPPPEINTTTLHPGQIANITDKIASGGSGNFYGYQWLVSYGSNALEPANLTTGLNECYVYPYQTVTANSTVSCNFYDDEFPPLPSGIYHFALQIKDPFDSSVVNSTESNITIINPPATNITTLNLPSISNKSIDNGQQSTTITDVIPNIWPNVMLYNYQWLVSYGSNALEPANLTTGSLFSAFGCLTYSSVAQAGKVVSCVFQSDVSFPNGTPALPIGTYHVALQIRNNLNQSEVLNSSASSFTIVNPLSRALTRALAYLTPNNSVIYQGQSSKLLITLPQTLGGNPPYSYKWLVCHGNCAYYMENARLATSICSKPSGIATPGETLVCIFSTNSSTATGTYTFYLQITDNESQTVSSPGINIAVYPKIPSAPAPSIVGPRIIDQYQSTTLVDAVPNYSQRLYGAFWFYSYNGGAYSSQSFSSAPSLCIDAPFSNMIPYNSPPAPPVSGEQIKCIFSPNPASAPPGVYTFELGLGSNLGASYSLPSPPIIVNPFLQLASINISNNKIVFGNSFNITANLSHNSRGLSYTGTPPYTYKLEIMPAGATEPVYIATAHISAADKFTFVVNSNDIGIGIYVANITVIDSAPISETSSLLSPNFTILNNLNATNLVTTTPNSNISVANVSPDIATPPINLAAVSILNITAQNKSKSSIMVTEKFPCGLKGIRPFILENNTWMPINLYTINENACTVTFYVPSDPIVGLMINRSSTNQALLNVTLIQNLTRYNRL